MTAQVRDDSLEAKLTYKPADETETFRRIVKSASDTVFSQNLSKIFGEQDAKDIENALEAQAVYFFENFQSQTAKNLAKMPAKEKEISERKYEELKNKKAKTAPVKTTRTVSRNFTENPFLNASFNPKSNESLFVNAAYKKNSAVEPEIETIETDTSIENNGKETKTIETEQGTVTRSSKANNKASFDGKVRTLEMSQEDSVETVFKTTGAKLSKVTKVGYGASFEACPDVSGILHGKGKSNIFSQTTINTGKQLAALTKEYTVNFQITAYVNDNAEMTHFDMIGVVSENILGFDRALRLDMIQSANGFEDGKRSISYKITGNTPPSETAPDQYGFKRNISSEFGTVTSKLFGINTNEEAERIVEIGRNGLGGMMIHLEMLMRSSISNWQNGECVEVECKAAKNSLKPNEAVDVTAVSVSKQDLGKFNAKLKASGTQTVTPAEQNGAPSAIYNLTAPSKDKATIVVRSVSKRGIGLGFLEIPVSDAKKKPPVKTPPKEPKKDCVWTGTVKAVRNLRVDKTEKADGRLIRAVSTKIETTSINVVITGERDLSGGIINNYIGSADANFLGTEYRERNYASGKMSCNQKIIMSPETQKFDDQIKGEARGRVPVAISVIGNRGFIMFPSPVISAERIITRTYESACPSYDQVNSSTDRNFPRMEVQPTGFEVEFETNSSTPNEIKGSKTVQNPDGSSTTYSWDLTRCK